MREHSRFIGPALLGTIAAVTPLAARAGLSHDDYLAALAKVEAKVERTQGAATLRARGGGDTAMTFFFGQTYRVGESWDVAAFAESSTMARKTNNPSDLPHLRPPEQRPGTAGRFHYEVTAANADSVTIRITQRDPIVDPRVQWVSLTFNRYGEETDKVYSLNGVAQPERVSPQGVHSRVSRLEIFPLDPAELTTAARSTATSIPALPPSLAALAGPGINQSSVAQLTAFSQDDFFGRPIRALWRTGDPWPAYLSTINGSAVLIAAKGGRQ